MITKERAIEIALLYIPTMLGDEADFGVTDEDLKETPKILMDMLPTDYKETLKK